MCTGMETAAIIGAVGGATAKNVSAAKQGEPMPQIQLAPQPDMSGLFDDDELLRLLAGQGANAL